MRADTRLTVAPPSALLVEPTSVCNLHCRMCPLPARGTTSAAQPGPMSDEVWRAIVEFARKAGQVTFAGYGEPLANPRCLELMRELDGLAVATHLTTNGTLVTSRIAGELAALSHLSAVSVSIDSPDPVVYREIRGGSVDRALEGVTRLVEALPASKIIVSSVMMRSTVGTLAAFPARLAAMGVRKYVVQGLLDYTVGLDEEELRWRNGLPAFVAAIRAACEEAGVELAYEMPDRVAVELRDPVEAEGTRAPARATQTKVCTAPWEVPVIDKDGRVFPCCYALTNRTAVVGDLTAQSAEDVWCGEKYEQFRRALLDGRTTPAICRTCTVVPSGQHPFALYAAEIVLEDSVLAGGTANTLVARNAGTVCWTRDDRVHIGTAAPRDHASAFYHPSWIGTNRVTSFREESVPPGGIATFPFQVAPEAGVPLEYFQLVVEGRCWMPNTRFRVDRDAARSGAGEGRSSLGRALIGAARRLVRRFPVQRY